MIIINQQDYWGAIRKRRKPQDEVIQRFVQPKIDYIKTVIASEGGNLADCTLLDVGSGNGFFSYYFEKICDVTCLDFSEFMLSINPCKKKVLGSASEISFVDDSFDIVFCSNLLHHVSNPQLVVAEMKRVSKKYIVVSEPNGSNPIMMFFGMMKREERITLKYTMEYLKNILKENSLTIISSATMGSVTPNKTPSFLLPILTRVNIGLYNIVITVKNTEVRLSENRI